MKALLSVLFFLALLGALSASWMEGLVEYHGLFALYRKRLQEQRRLDGQRVWQRYVRALPEGWKEQTRRPLDLGPLFVASQQQHLSLEEEAWAANFLGALLASLHPEIEADPALGHAIAEQVISLTRTRQLGPDRTGYTGKIRCTADLQALPLPDLGQRALWLACCSGEAPCRSALEDWIEISSSWGQAAPIEHLPPTVRQLLFGQSGGQILLETTPSQRMPVALQHLDPRAHRLLPRLVDLGQWRRPEH